MPRIEQTPDDIVIYEEPSASKPGESHRASICLQDGAVDCTCRDYEMRLRPLAASLGIQPNITSVRFHCNHIDSAIRDCLRRGEISFSIPVPQRGI